MPDSLHKLTETEVRPLVNYAIKLIPAATLRDLQQGLAEKRAMALDLATDVVVAQLGRARHEVVHGS